MANPRQATPDEIQAAVEAVAHYGSQVKAAEALGIARETLQRRLRRAQDKADDFIRPTIPDTHEAPADRWARRAEQFRNRRAHHQAREWMAFRMRRLEPCAILWFGDPHLDDDGCDMDALERAIQIGRQPGVYSVGIGDYTNNWVGRLARLYAHQESGAKSAWQDAAYFIRDTGLTWLTLIKGNHDLWSGKGDPLDFIAEGVSDVATWRAQFKLTWPNGVELMVDAAHDHKGNSQWSDSFGAKKAAYMDGRADIYVAGHKHTASLDRFRHPWRGSMHETFRVRGFKYFDSYALQNGFPEQQGSEAMLTVIDPRRGSSGRPAFRTFDDVEEGADYLAWRRS